MSADLKKANRASAYLTDEIIAPWPDSTRLLVRGSRDDIQVGMRQIHLSQATSIDGRVESPLVTVYDTLGRYADPTLPLDVLAGLPPMRKEWINERGDTEQLDGRAMHHASAANYPGQRHRHVNVARTRRAYRGGAVTQLHYARKGLVTPEMEYVAIRENCGIALCDDEPEREQNNERTSSIAPSSVITPEFVRHEIACGRAVIPNNVNHPETEPMIIGRNFGVKVAACLQTSVESPSLVDEIAQIIMALQSGADTVIECSYHPLMAENRDWVLRNSSIPIGSVPLLHALQKVDGVADALTWKLYRDTLIEHVEQGVDYIHLLSGTQFPNKAVPGADQFAQDGSDSQIISGGESDRALINFLPAHFDEICDIMRAYDVTLMLEHELPTHSNGSDKTQVDALELQMKLVDLALCSDVQVIAKGNARCDISRLSLAEMMDAKIKECSEVPEFSYFQATDETIHNVKNIAHVRNTAQTSLTGNALLCCMVSAQKIERTLTRADRQHLMICSQVAHAINLANGQPAACLRDKAMSAALAQQRHQDYINLSISPELTRQILA